MRHTNSCLLTAAMVGTVTSACLMAAGLRLTFAGAVFIAISPVILVVGIGAVLVVLSLLRNLGGRKGVRNLYLDTRPRSAILGRMGRPHRAAEGGYVYHVLNRGNARMHLFDDETDYDAFEKVLAEAVERSDMRLLAHCLMPNHWHLLVWPRKDGDLSRFVGWLTLTHTQRWHAHRHSVGYKHVYQGRFKSFAVPEDDHYYSVARYVERNALRANFVRRAEDWRWCSLYRWLHGAAQDRPSLAAWPLPRKASWVEYVNAPQSEAELAAIRRSLERGNPFGSEPWNERTIRRLGLESTIRARGRPKKGSGR